MRASPLSTATPVRPRQSSDELLEDLEYTARYADDKERLVGLIVAPIAAGIAILVTKALFANDPPRLLRDGAINKLHVSSGLYEGLALVLLGLSIVMLTAAWWRRRLYLGIATALYGLAVFNLHYWGFGVPFVMVGAWLMVRAYRAQQAVKEARARA